MPKLMLEMQRLLDSPDCDLDRLVRVVEREPMVSTKVVGIASSAIYVRTQPVRGLRDAVFRIGLRETKNVVLAIVCQSKLFRVPGFEAEANVLYRHALASAIAARSPSASTSTPTRRSSPA